MASKPSDLLQTLRESAGMDTKVEPKRKAANVNKGNSRQKAGKPAAAAKSKAAASARRAS